MKGQTVHFPDGPVIMIVVDGSFYDYATHIMIRIIRSKQDPLFQAFQMVGSEIQRRADRHLKSSRQPTQHQASDKSHGLI